MWRLVAITNFIKAYYIWLEAEPPKWRIKRHREWRKYRPNYWEYEKLAAEGVKIIF